MDSPTLIPPRPDAPSPVRGPIRLARSFLADEEGATMVEYGLMIAFIAVVVIAAVTTLGTKLKAPFTTVSGAFGGS